MQEDKFEKQVREKMDQLHFNPEERVWSVIDEEINKKKKRRLPFSWFFLFGSLLLAGGVLYMHTNEKGSKQFSDAFVKSMQTDSTQIKSSSYSSTDSLNNSKTSTANHKPIAFAPNPDDRKTNRHKNNRQLQETLFNFREPVSSTSDLTKSNSTTDVITNKSPGANPGSKKDSVSNSVTKKQEQSKKKSSWKFRLRTDLGISDIYQSSYHSGTLSNAPSGSNTGQYAENIPNAGFSFGVGFFFERALNKKILVSIGLNYHYYSTHIQTGGYMTQPSPVYSGSSGSYYSNGLQSDFTNQYHLLEIPLSFDYLLNPKKRPMYIEASLSPGWLFTSNALYYEPSGNVYIKNNHSIQPVQLNGGIAFLMAFNLQKNQLRLGPMFQYGFTSVLKSQYGNPEHLVYGGLKLVFIPRKNN